jgi:hypothetical protein
LLRADLAAFPFHAVSDRQLYKMFLRVKGMNSQWAPLGGGAFFLNRRLLPADREGIPLDEGMIAYQTGRLICVGRLFLYQLVSAGSLQFSA